MRTTLFFALTASVALFLVGCGPKPVASDAESRPAVDVSVTPDSTEVVTPPGEADSDATGVDVQVGGGQGVQVEVDREPATGN